MKRFFLVLGILALISCSAKAAENNLKIEFKEFCPYKKLQNIDTSKRYILPSKQYWSERKKKFDELKDFCLGLDNDDKKVICIDRLRIFEKNLTVQYFDQQTKQTEESFAPVLVFPFSR